MKLLDKTVLITGAAHGIGRACAEAFAREGARVVVADRDAESGTQVADMICDAGDESKFITGTVLPVDGGWTAQ